jgi:NAD-dependent SIR2 family protein deacetylase
MFDIDFFRSNPRPFFAFAKELFPKSKGFTFIPSRYISSSFHSPHFASHKSKIA